jgi:hypothetical protein
MVSYWALACVICGDYWKEELVKRNPGLDRVEFEPTLDDYISQIVDRLYWSRTIEPSEMMTP